MLYLKTVILPHPGVADSRNEHTRHSCSGLSHNISRYMCCRPIGCALAPLHPPRPMLRQTRLRLDPLGPHPSHFRHSRAAWLAGPFALADNS
jgi:hypothetical protein